MTPIEMLRAWQWRGDGFSCICCGRLHRFGCKPACELTALLAPKGIEAWLPTDGQEFYGVNRSPEPPRLPFTAGWSAYYDHMYPGRRIKEAMEYAASQLERDLFPTSQLIVPLGSLSAPRPRRKVRRAPGRKSRKRGSSTR